MLDVTNFLKKDFSLIWIIWAVEKEVSNCFNVPTVVAKLDSLLGNFCSCKWPNPTLVNSLISWGFWILNVLGLLGLCLLNLRICLLKALTDSEFRISFSSIFHTIKWKQYFRKYSFLKLSKGILLWFQVIRIDKTLGSMSNR